MSWLTRYFVRDPGKNLFNALTLLEAEIEHDSEYSRLLAVKTLGPGDLLAAYSSMQDIAYMAVVLLAVERGVPASEILADLRTSIAAALSESPDSV